MNDDLFNFLLSSISFFRLDELTLKTTNYTMENIQTEITYLFGAGASFYALPLVKDFPDRLNRLANRLTNEFQMDQLSVQVPRSINGKQPLYSELLDELIVDLNWLHSVADNHASIDTFAKKLKIKGKNSDLKRLKNALSVFFHIEQTMKSLDRRYDSFLASVLDSTKLPANLKIISWNYDQQLEMAFTDYFNSNGRELEIARKYLGLVEKYGDLDPLSTPIFFKLNGSANYSSRSGFDQLTYNDELIHEFSIENIKRILNSFFIVKTSSEAFSKLSFAWEPVIDSKSIIQFTKNRTSTTKVVVSIGYSFPFFNRKIDREILGNMTNLKKVYVQCPDAVQVIERAKGSVSKDQNVEFIPVFGVEQFYLPIEL